MLHLDSGIKVILKNLSQSNKGCLKDHFIQHIRRMTVTDCAYKVVSQGLVFDQSGCVL